MELQRVLEAYRAMEPVRDVINLIKTQFATDQRWTLLEFQAQIVQVVVKDSVCDHFCPLQKYTCKFLKSFVGEIEAVHASLDDGLMESLMEFVVNIKRGDDELNAEAMHHVSYTVPTTDSSVVLTCRVASVINEVGLRLWEAGWLLAEYIIAHKSEFCNRNVLELGAGVGFTGMVLACVSRARRIVLTDYAPNVMQNLRYNVEINASNFVCPVQVQTLDWETWQPSADYDERPDILLAGDCAYDVAAFPHIMRVLQLFLANDEGAIRQPSLRVALFAATIRNQKTFQELLDQLAAHCIEYVDITTSSLKKMGKPIYMYPNREQIRICRLTRMIV